MAQTSDSIACCLVCGSDKLKLLPRYKAHHLVRCRKCSFVFSSRRPSQEELDRVYSRYRRGESNPTGLTLKRQYDITKWLMSLCHIKTVLDVGCGDGHLLKCFSDRRVITYGTEYNADSAAVAAKRGANILQGGLEPQLPVGVDGFDAIIFTEVIEHINNPSAITSHFLNLLKPGGLLYITTPNFRSIESALLGPKWGMVMYPEHLCYYTPATLNTLLCKTGFEKVCIQTENISFFRLAQFWAKRNSGVGAALDPEGFFSGCPKRISH